ncbi:hypothetical protein RclHR1_12440008 [Rhizophagus clarus]|uniref:Uncharacterized protein n=1 Tax=Rhizophagus clarus TaxID=94130 RepID=A0A2Z6Q8X3_9GLOM|nr:hypothetical protein RclHR1_12440008 [Rhizophagus clarus]GES73121.1 hypothetical protein RCL_e29051_RclHR1_12440008 [Rhizophagus clarus]
MSQPNIQDIGEELFKTLRNNFTELILENIKKEQTAYNFVWPRSSTWNNQRNVSRYPSNGLQSPPEQFIELSKYWDVCPYLLTYMHHLSLSTLVSAIALSQGVRENDTKSGQVEIQDAPIIAEDIHALMDIEISPIETN